MNHIQFAELAEKRNLIRSLYHEMLVSINSHINTITKQN